MKKNAIVIGTGSAGLIAAKELKEKGLNVRLIEKHSELGGIWSSLPWKTYTLTSSKWVTEYGCYPMPEDFPDFVTNEHMLRYLVSFAEAYQLRPLIDFNVNVSAIKKNQDGSFNLVTDKGSYENIDYVVVSSGLHGKPFTPEYAGIDQFEGETIHSSKYDDPGVFSDKKVLCVGLGESGVGLISELATVTTKLVVSSEGVAVAPRVIKGSQNPFDQMQFWQIGRYLIGYQEVLTTGLSWYYKKIPAFLKRINMAVSLKFYSDYGVEFKQFEPWFPKALVPNHFHVKFWTKPHNSTCNGNLTRKDAPSDDLFYLLKTGKILPKGKVKSFDSTGALFDDGSHEDIDMIIFNTGYTPGSKSIKFPIGWEYNHQDLFKGCLHPTMPNLAFVGMVRPTIGSIPAMAEMHARIIAAYFSASLQLPSEDKRIETIKQEQMEHQKQFPHMHERFPHIYFFDDWMEKMATLIGAAPRVRDHLSSFEKLRAYFFGAPMPLRYRIRGEGKRENAEEIYIKRVNTVWGNAFGKWAFVAVLMHFLTPYLLSVIFFVLSYSTFGFSGAFSIVISILFFLLYCFVDIVRFIFSIAFGHTLSILMGVFFVRGLKREAPDFDNPKVFQTVE